MWCFSVVLLSEIGNMLDIQGKIKFCKELVVVWWTITRVVCVLCHRRKWGLWYTVGLFHLAAVCFSPVSFHFLLRKHHLWEQHLSLGSLLCPRGCCLPRAAGRRSSLAKPQPWLQQGAIIYLIKPPRWLFFILTWTWETKVCVNFSHQTRVPWYTLWDFAPVKMHWLKKES